MADPDKAFRAWLEARRGRVSADLDLFSPAEGGDRVVRATKDIAEGQVRATLWWRSRGRCVPRCGGGPVASGDPASASTPLPCPVRRAAAHPPAHRMRALHPNQGGARQVRTMPHSVCSSPSQQQTIRHSRRLCPAPQAPR
jgi:hypothetical protein